MVSQIIHISIVLATVCSGANQTKHQSSASLAFVRGIHRWPVNFPYKGPVTRKCFHLLTSSFQRTRINPSGVFRDNYGCWWLISLGRHGPLARYVKLRVAHAPGMPGTFSPPPRVSDPDMHHGTRVTHVPWCMPGSLTSIILWSRWQGRRSRHSWRMRNPQFYVTGKRPIVSAPIVMTLSYEQVIVFQNEGFRVLARFHYRKFIKKADTYLWFVKWNKRDKG